MIEEPIFKHTLNMYKPNCQQPVLLFNKFVFSMLQSGGKLTLCNKPVHVSHIQQIPVEHWLKSAREYTEDELDNSYCELSGNKEPLFLYVPCMHCDLCLHSKQVDYINRSILETLTWDCPPVFFTLTYRDSSLPSVVIGRKKIVTTELQYKDIQDFFKRLRQRWNRKKIKHDIRYMVAGEYGSKRGRCHWHVILWNNPYNCNELQPIEFQQLKEDIFFSWGKCDAEAFDFGQCKGGAAPYATKYVTKPSLTHGHHTKPMIRCSSGRRGGLGSIYLSRDIEYLRQNPTCNYLDYVDKNGNYGYMLFSKSISKKVWPSLSSLVPSSTRLRYKELTDTLSALSTVYDNEPYLAEIAQLLRPQYVTNNYKRQKLLQCPIIRAFRLKTLVPLVNTLIDELSVVQIFDSQYVEKLYIRKASLIPVKFDSQAQQVSKIRMHNAVQLSKEKL